MTGAKVSCYISFFFFFFSSLTKKVSDEEMFWQDLMQIVNKEAGLRLSQAGKSRKSLPDCEEYLKCASGGEPCVLRASKERAPFF